MQWLIIWHILNYYVTSLYSEDKFILNSIIIENTMKIKIQKISGV